MKEKKDVIMTFIGEGIETFEFKSEAYVYYHVYVLYDDNNPVYCGSTKDIATRIKAHKLDKKFDAYRIVYTNVDKKKVYNVEASIIRFVFAHNNGDCYNKRTGWIADTSLHSVSYI